MCPSFTVFPAILVLHLKDSEFVLGSAEISPVQFQKVPNITE